jgi:hypothetical protein
MWIKAFPLKLRSCSRMNCARVYNNIIDSTFYWEWQLKLLVYKHHYKLIISAYPLIRAALPKKLYSIIIVTGAARVSQRCTGHVY